MGKEKFEMQQVVEFFAGFSKIADSLNIPCDISPEMVRQKNG